MFLLAAFQEYGKDILAMLLKVFLADIVFAYLNMTFVLTIDALHSSELLCTYHA
jgi:hypothetical protein